MVLLLSISGGHIFCCSWHLILGWTIRLHYLHLLWQFQQIWRSMHYYPCHNDGNHNRPQLSKWMVKLQCNKSSSSLYKCTYNLTVYKECSSGILHMFPIHLFLIKRRNWSWHLANVSLLPYARFFSDSWVKEKKHTRSGCETNLTGFGQTRAHFSVWGKRVIHFV